MRIFTYININICVRVWMRVCILECASICAPQQIRFKSQSSRLLWQLARQTVSAAGFFVLVTIVGTDIALGSCGCCCFFVCACIYDFCFVVVAAVACMHVQYMRVAFNLIPFNCHVWQCGWRKFRTQSHAERTSRLAECGCN